MATPVDQLTVQEAHAEFDKVMSRIAAIGEKLVSGNAGDADCEIFSEKIKELAPLYARITQLCKKLNIPWPSKLWRPPHFKH